MIEGLWRGKEPGDWCSVLSEVLGVKQGRSWSWQGRGRNWLIQTWPWWKEGDLTIKLRQWWPGGFGLTGGNGKVISNGGNRQGEESSVRFWLCWVSVPQKSQERCRPRKATGLGGWEDSRGFQNRGGQGRERTARFTHRPVSGDYPFW